MPYQTIVDVVLDAPTLRASGQRRNAMQLRTANSIDWDSEVRTAASHPHHTTPVSNVLAFNDDERSISDIRRLLALAERDGVNMQINRVTLNECVEHLKEKLLLLRQLEAAVLERTCCNL